MFTSQVRRSLLIFSIFAISVGLIHGPQASADGRGQSESIEKVLKKSSISRANISLYIQKINGPTAEAVFGLNEGQKRVPASLSKIYSAAAILQHYSVNDQFVTQILGPKKSQGTVQGSICLKGGGDPGFVSESMWFLVNELTRHNISAIEGNLFVDSTRFDLARFDSSRESVRVDRAYDAPVSAMSFNWNSVNLFIRPGKKGQPVTVIADPVSEYIEIVNEAKTVSGARQNVTIQRTTSAQSQNQKDVFKITGEWGENAGEKVYYRGITNPDMWSGLQLKSFLAQRGIRLSGQVKTGACPGGLVVLAEAKSKPMSQHLSDMLKFSNNFVAEMLVKNLAADELSPPGDISKGVKLIKEMIQKKGLRDSQIMNPSGLTRDNQATVKDINQVLLDLYRDYRVMPEFMSGLPIGGHDGTLKSRMKSSEGWIRAKTGLLNGAVGLAGYASTKAGEMYAFSFVFNGPGSQEASARQLFDEVAETLIR